jgi:hypothetical protein
VILETETPSMFKTAMTIIGDVMTYITTSMVTLTKLGQLSYSQDMLLEEYMEIRKVAKKIFDTTEGLKRATHAKIEIVVTQEVLQQSFMHVCVQRSKWCEKASCLAWNLLKTCDHLTEKREI